MKIDYNKVGLKCGLEVHVQLNTKNKLFCSCLTKLEDKLNFSFLRKLRPTKSELGEIDPAAYMEFKRDRTYIYQVSPDSVCLVEMDEEPPHSINKEAIEIALTCALLMNSKIIDEIHVMRKEVIDGSNTTGFQRTAIVALKGYIIDRKEKIEIDTITLEEDASRKIEEKDKNVTYKLDRLCIPLIEIATSAQIKNPEQAKRVAYQIGLLLKSTNKIKKGIGTIRQDINISISGGAKTEIKGIQELGLIPKVIEYEVQRQLKLLELKKILNEKKVPKPEKNYINVTHVFKNTKSKLILKNLEKNKEIFLLPLKMMRGLLKFEIQPNRRFASELADYVKSWTNLEGIIHSDELPGYGIINEEVNLLYKNSKLNFQTDAFILVIGNKEECIEALNKIVERINNAFIGIPEETRNSQIDGTTRYARPRPGAARMYPETDIPPFIVTEEFIEQIKRKLPKKIEDKIILLQDKYKISNQLARELIDSQMEDLFEKIVELKVKPSIVATVLTQMTKYFKRIGISIENVKEEHFIDIFKALKERKIVKESIEKILPYLAKNPNLNVDQAIQEIGLRLLTKEEIEKIVNEIIKEKIKEIKENKERSFNTLVKLTMSKVRGKADSSLVVEIIKEKLSEI